MHKNYCQNKNFLEEREISIENNEKKEKVLVPPPGFTSHSKRIVLLSRGPHGIG